MFYLCPAFPKENYTGKMKKKRKKERKEGRRNEKNWKEGEREKERKYCSMTVHIKKVLSLSQRFTIGFFE